MFQQRRHQYLLETFPYREYFEQERERVYRASQLDHQEFIRQERSRVEVEYRYYFDLHVAEVERSERQQAGQAVDRQVALLQQPAAEAAAAAGREERVEFDFVQMNGRTDTSSETSAASSQSLANRAGTPEGERQLEDDSNTETGGDEEDEARDSPDALQQEGEGEPASKRQGGDETSRDGDAGEGNAGSQSASAAEQPEAAASTQEPEIMGCLPTNSETIEKLEAYVNKFFGDESETRTRRNNIVALSKGRSRLYFSSWESIDTNDRTTRNVINVADNMQGTQSCDDSKHQQLKEATEMFAKEQGKDLLSKFIEAVIYYTNLEATGFMEFLLKNRLMIDCNNEGANFSTKNFHCGDCFAEILKLEERKDKKEEEREEQ